MRRILAVVTVALLAACASPTPYAPADKYGNGFTEQKIESNRYRVVFQGNSLTKRDVVENGLLYRAAELTVAQGYDYFVAIGKSVDSETTLRPDGISPRIGFSASYYRGYPSYRSGYGYGLAYDPWLDQPSYREVQKFTAVSEIALFKGPKPAGDVNAYDARDVLANVKVTLPTPK